MFGRVNSSVLCAAICSLHLRKWEPKSLIWSREWKALLWRSEAFFT